MRLSDSLGAVQSHLARGPRPGAVARIPRPVTRLQGPGTATIGAVSLKRTSLQIPRCGGFQAANWRHSARAAERFTLNVARWFRWRSRLKWLWIEACAEANFCRVLMSLNLRHRALSSSKRLM